jgi:UDP-N-acetylmuramoyl-tripeptide--D-alanyl-D-alanine ligase
VTFGLGEGADVTARRVEPLAGPAPGSRFELRLQAGAVNVELPLPGQHNVMNALAAAALAEAAGASAAQIRDGLAAARPVAGRLVVKPGPRGCRIVDDTYNANPASMKAALDVLAKMPGRPWAVLGDMGELGGDALALHREIGAYARERGIERLFAVGPMSRETAAGFGTEATHLDHVDVLCATLPAILEGDVNLLVKASRMMRLEQVVDALSEHEDAQAATEATD